MGAVQVLLMPGHPALRPLLAALGPGFAVAVPGRPTDPRQSVALVAALGLDEDEARARVESTALRQGMPAVGVVDLAPLRLGGPALLLPLDELTPGALARALLLARTRGDRRVTGEACIGVACDAALRALARSVAASTQGVSLLRRQALRDPRAARHADGLAWSLRAMDTAIAATLEDPAGGQPVPVHALPSLALPLIEAALGQGVRIETDTSRAPLGLAPPAAVALLVHAASDARAATAVDGPHPLVSITVAEAEAPGHAQVRLLARPAHEETTIVHQATATAAARCAARVAGSGGEIAIDLPLATPSRQPAPAVLVVDDHLEVAEVVAETLRGADLAVAVAGTAEQALDHLARHPATRVVVSDVALPGLDGVDLADRLAAAHCPARILLITGFAEDRPQAAQRSGLVSGVLHKPFAPDALLAAVRALLA